MTRKDYIAIADTLIACQGAISVANLATVVGVFASRLSDTYPNFDAGKFISYVGAALEAKDGSNRNKG